MEYSEEEYNQDLRLSKYTFRKFFKNCVDCQDDLVQVGLMWLWKHKGKFDISKSSYANFAIMVCKCAMLRFLNKRKRLTNSGENLSLDYDYEGVVFADLLPFEEDYESKLYYERVFNQCRQVVSTFKSKRMREICYLYLDFVPVPEITKRLGFSRQYIHQQLNKFQSIMQTKYAYFLE